MNGKQFAIATLFVLVLLTVAFIPLSTQQSGSYDPWLDYNEDGNIDVNDLHPLGEAYGSSGNPTKNVNVINWPVRRAVTLYYFEPLSPGQVLVSSFVNASGFGHLHILSIGSELGYGEEINVQVQGVIRNKEGLAGIVVPVYSFTLDLANRFNNATIPVPCEEFRFTIDSSLATTASICLSYYLTWA